MAQENKGLVPKIETPNEDSEFHQPVGRLIAERIKYRKKPLDVIPVFSLQQSMPLRSLIRKMTSHVPNERISAAKVVEDLRDKLHNVAAVEWGLHAVELQVIICHMLQKCSCCQRKFIQQNQSF